MLLRLTEPRSSAALGYGCGPKHFAAQERGSATRSNGTVYTREKSCGRFGF